MKEGLDFFRDRFENQSGSIHVVSNFDEAASMLRVLLKYERVNRLAVASCTEARWKDLEKNFEGSGIELVSSNRGVAEIEKCRAGLTFPVLGIAETGSVLEVNTDDADRLVSSLSVIHACYLPAKAIVKDLMDAAPTLKTLNSHSRFVASIISGPSRTADIEMQQVLGVHGPHAVHVYVEV